MSSEDMKGAQIMGLTSIDSSGMSGRVRRCEKTNGRSTLTRHPGHFVLKLDIVHLAA
jgi:hypothetical protein